MIGRTIGTYRIDAKLGQGGMGAVYKGLDLMLERPVAIKALRADIAASSQHVERFRQEAKTLARLLHPHIATLYALLREGDDLYMVMEFVEGETFEAVLHRERRIPVEHALRLFDQALRGIDHAHQRGIIHRDVKPANFMVMPSGTVKVMDFGIARLLGSTRMTQTRHAIGTAEYMAPEQVRAREVDARTDVYALGILLYEMVTGRVPFEAESSFETMQAHLQAEPRSPRVLTSDLPESVESAILTALAKAPDDRHASVAAFRAALADVTPTGPPIPLPVPLVEEPEPKKAAPKTKPPSGPAPETLIAPAREEAPAAELPDAPPKITDALALDEGEADPNELADDAPPEPASDEATRADDTDDASSTDDDPPTVPSPATRIAAPATVVADAVISDPDKTAPATVIAPAAVAPTVVAPSPARETTMAAAPDRAAEPPGLPSSLRTLPRAAIAGVLATLVVAAGLWMLRPSTPERPEGPETIEQTDDPDSGSRAGGGGGLASAGSQTGEFAVPPGPPPEIIPAAPQEPDAGSQTVQEPRPAERPPERRAEDPPARTTPSQREDTRQPERRGPEPRQPERREPERIRTEPAAPQTGTARVLVRPFGDVYIDGQRLARGTNAPVTADLAPGTYTVRATHPVFGEITDRVRVRAGETSDVRLQFATPVEVTVTSSPSNAEILLDGRPTGRYTPATISVPPGNHRIAVERNGVATPSRSLTITAGQSPARIQFSLTQAP
ncbi:MAG: hypothetical protein Rubg2KO_32920 [Rubricoccaceae bacterium]